jgi:ribonuclease G
MSKEVIVNIEEHERRICFVENGLLEEYYLERPDSQRLTGNIYRGKVTRVMPGIQAAFVNIGLRRNAFLHISDITEEKAVFEEVAGEELDEVKRPKATKKKEIEDYLKVGDDIIVQVVKDSIGTKGPRLSTNISLPGKYVVLLPRSERRGISRRISDQKARDEATGILKALKLPKNMGAIMRTFAQNKSFEECAEDLKLLKYIWRRVYRKFRDAGKPTLLHSEKDLLKRIVRDSLTDDVAMIVIDSKKEYEEIDKYLKAYLPRSTTKVELYQGEEPVFEAHNLEKEIEKAYRNKIWLKCGGYVVIEQTEALVAIDVNTGRNLGRNDVEKTILTTNLEAAREVARQLRLRNMGGIIVIDFIDMQAKGHQKILMDELRAALERDKARTHVLPVSEIGLVQMTRERDKESIGEMVTGECPYCRGTGYIKDVESISIDIQRQLRKLANNGNRDDIKVCANPEVIEQLRNKHGAAVEKITDKARFNVEFLPVADYHLEEWNCLKSQ